jgi:hypothetical protein
VGVEYFEIIPSVKAMTARSLGTFSPILLAVLIMVTAKARLPQNGVDGFIFQQFPIIISQVSSSIFMMRFSLKGCR